MTLPLKALCCGCSLSESCHALSVRGAFVLLIYIVLDGGQLVAWFVASGGM
jgi:hypothetical protein